MSPLGVDDEEAPSDTRACTVALVDWMFHYVNNNFRPDGCQVKVSPWACQAQGPDPGGEYRDQGTRVEAAGVGINGRCDGDHLPQWP